MVMKVDKEKLMALAELNGIKICKEPECVKFPHFMEKNMYHVPCAMCGLPRPYVEYKDWQTQEEMMKMCSPCITEVSQ